MLQKIYSDKIEEGRDIRSQRNNSEGLRSKKLDLNFYQRTLKRNRWPILIFTALAVAAAVFYTRIAPPIYAANATLLLESQKANIVSIEDLVSSGQESKDYYGTQIAILRSRVLAERVLLQLERQKDISNSLLTDILVHQNTQNIDWGAQIGTAAIGSETAMSSMSSTSGEQGSTTSGTLNSNKEFNELISEFRKSLSVKPVANTKLVTIVFESVDPRFSAMAANAVAEQYIESVLERRNTLKDEVSEWMSGRIKELKSKLDASEEALLYFKRSNGLIELDGSVGRLNEQELLVKSSELSEARNELSIASDMYRKIQNFKSSSPQYLESLPFVQNDILVRSAKIDLGNAERDLLALKNRYGFKHPRIIDAESKLISLRATLNSRIERVVSSFENDYQLLQQRVTSLENDVVVSKQNIQVVGQQKIILESLERKVAANRDQYNGLFDRITETQTTEGLNEANAVIAEAAWMPTQPIKPKKILIIGLALIGSLLLAAAISFLLEFFNDTVNSTEDIERRLKNKLIGVIPLIKGGIKGREKDLPLSPLGLDSTSKSFSEAVNTCRTSLSLADDPKLQVILVTSSVPNEGKSTVALNLAHSFGQLEQTLLIDCDLRRPSIATALDMPVNAIGLSSVLLKNSTNQHYLNRNVLNSFDCLTSGPVPDKPLEMLSSAEFARILHRLRQYYDRIIIDSPPTHVVSDALVLSKLSDGVVYVVKPHDTSIKLIDSCLSKLSDAGASVEGICLSQVDIDSLRSYSGFDLYGFGVDYKGSDGYYTKKDDFREQSASAGGSDFKQFMNRVNMKKSA